VTQPLVHKTTLTHYCAAAAAAAEAGIAAIAAVAASSPYLTLVLNAEYQSLSPQL